MLGPILREALGISVEPAMEKLPVLGVTSDSREIKPGFIFVAIEGGSQDSHAFVGEKSVGPSAVPIAVIGQRALQTSLPYFKVSNSRDALARLASSFYKNPSHRMQVLGVTGTSGKTTTSYILESILEASGKKVGVIGTINFRFGKKIYPSTHTTPGPVELQSLLAEMLKDGCQAVVMEVSSHALKQSRVASIAFDGVLFTNLSPEHLDFHPDMEDYFASKSILFHQISDESRAAGKKTVAVAHEADSYGKRLLDGAKGVRGFTVPPSLTLSASGIRGKIGDVEIQSELIGRFNAENIAGAVALTRGLGISAQQVSQGVRNLKTVPGRLEKVVDPRGEIEVRVDYAHKPDALEKVLLTLKEVAKGRIITVMGCGGDRDRTKRPKMGQIAVSLSDQTWITSDNPRTEDPEAIIQEIMNGVHAQGAAGSRYKIQPDRRQAILEAIRFAQAGDLVVICGKGHENYQIVGSQKLPFDDCEIAREALKTRNIP